MYFSTWSGPWWSHAVKLWRTDGTEAGTQTILDLRPPEMGSSWISGLEAVGSRLLFSVSDSAYGSELWQIAAPDAAPALILDLQPGPWGSIHTDYHPLDVVPLAGGLLWTAWDQETGDEPRYLAPGFAPRVEPAWAGGPSGGLATAPVTLGNRGAASQPVTLTLTLPAGVSLASHTLGVSPTISDTAATWALPSLPTGEHIARLAFRLPEAPLGSAVTATLSLEPGDASVPVRLEIARQYYLPLAASQSRP